VFDIDGLDMVVNRREILLREVDLFVSERPPGSDETAGMTPGGIVTRLETNDDDDPCGREGPFLEGG
jgi:hypothetical protein